MNKKKKSTFQVITKVVVWAMLILTLGGIVFQAAAIIFN
ncbi:DUF4044 domain-containing protein [Enterococcus sp. HY326]|nr:DUF4044 domain-containing protein [Enterococcus sp. HY326]